MTFTKAMTSSAKLKSILSHLNHTKIASFAYNLTVQSGACITAEGKHGLVNKAVAKCMSILAWALLFDDEATAHMLYVTALLHSARCYSCFIIRADCFNSDAFHRWF